MATDPFDRFQEEDKKKEPPVDPFAPAAKKHVPKETPDLANTIAAAGSENLPLEDAPTIGSMPMPQANNPLPSWVPIIGGKPGKDVRGRPGIPLKSSLALGFGIASTDNPKARQEIVAEHVPDAKPVTDKWGNPMIEYQGKRYYTSRPGEVDDLDINRGIMATLGMAPAAAVAPISGPGAVAFGGLLNIGQSYAEDAVTRAAGGKSQTYDHDKAAVAGTIGTFVPIIGKMLAYPAAWAYGRMAGPLFDATGNPTMRGMTLLREAGMTQQQIETMTPDIRQQITTMVNQSFGDPRAATAGYRTGLSREANVPLTVGEITGDPAQILKEKNWRGGSSASGPQTIMQGYDALRRDRLNVAQDTLRRQAGGGQTFTPQEATTLLTAEQKAAQATEEAAKNQQYTVGKNPALLASSGIPPVPVQDMATLGQTVRHQLNQSGPGRSVIDFPHNTPVTARALQDVEEWAAGTAGPRGAGQTSYSWEEINNMRIQLGRRRSAAVRAGDAQDIQAMDELMAGFDRHFTTQTPARPGAPAQSGPMNPVLDTARQMNVDVKTRFTPQDSHTPLTNEILGRLNDPASTIAGGEIVDKLLSGVKGGKAVETLQHLQTIHPRGSPAHQVLEEQSIMRLLVDERGQPLSPARIVTKIDDALGQKEGPFYRTLLTPDQIAELVRRRELMHVIATAGQPNNPSGSGHLAVAAGKSAANQAVGASVGAIVAEIVGGSRIGQLVGAAAGRSAGAIVGNAWETGGASRAITPGPRTGITPNRAGPASLLAAPAVEGADREQMPPTGVPTAAGPAIGPIDRLWRGLLQ